MPGWGVMMLNCVDYRPTYQYFLRQAVIHSIILIGHSDNILLLPTRAIGACNCWSFRDSIQHSTLNCLLAMT